MEYLVLALIFLFSGADVSPTKALTAPRTGVSSIGSAETADAGGRFDPNGATTDVGNHFDPNGATTDVGGMFDPNGATTDVGSLFDPNG